MVQAQAVQVEEAAVERTPYQILKVSLDRIKQGVKGYAIDFHNLPIVDFTIGIGAIIIAQLKEDQEELRPTLVNDPRGEAEDIWGDEPERETQRQFQRHVHVMLFLSDSVAKWLLEEEILTGLLAKQRAAIAGAFVAETAGWGREIRDLKDEIFRNLGLVLESPKTSLEAIIKAFKNAWTDKANNVIGTMLGLTSYDYWQYNKALKTAFEATKRRFPKVKPLKTLDE